MTGPETSPPDPNIERLRDWLPPKYVTSLPDKPTKPAEAKALHDALAAVEADLEAAKAALREATTIARHLHGMIDRETWRAQGAEWMGQYEGDRWAAQTRADIERLAALAAPDPEGDD